MPKRLSDMIASASTIRARWGAWFYLAKTAGIALVVMLCAWQAITFLGIATPCVTALAANVFMTFCGLLAIAGAVGVHKCRHHSYVVCVIAKLAQLYTAALLGMVLGLVSAAHWA